MLEAVHMQMPSISMCTLTYLYNTKHALEEEVSQNDQDIFGTNTMRIKS